MKYRLLVSKSPDFDSDEERYESDLQDIANSIPDKISDVKEESVKVEENEIYFETKMNEREIKSALKDVFSFHFENVRFVSLTVV